MDTAIKERIAPMVPKNSKAFSDAAVKSPTQAQEGEPKIDFKSLLQTSNADVSRERVAKNPKDLSAAKTEDEFYKMLSDRANPNSNAPKNKLDKDDFLKLFVAQLRNQDPLKPDDAAQMAAQLAQFNGLEQMMNVNKNLEQLTKLQESGQAVGLLDYVGKEVSVEGGRLMVSKGELTDASFNIEQPISGAELEVRDSTGLVIAQKGLGVLNPGEHRLSWDGINKDGEKVKDGIYTFAVVAQGLEGAAVPVGIKSKVRITGVDMKDPGGSFFTELGKVGVNEISSVGVVGHVVRTKPATEPAKESAAEPVTEPAKESASGQATGQVPGQVTGQVTGQVKTEPVLNEAAPVEPTTPDLSPGAREIAVNP